MSDADALVRSVLGTSKRLWDDLDGLDRGTMDNDALARLVKWKRLKRMVKEINVAVQQLKRTHAEAAIQARTRESMLREAMRDELIDREANAARVLERQRTLFDRRQDNSLSTYDHAITAAAQIDAALAGLTPPAVTRCVGVDQLAAGTETA